MVGLFANGFLTNLFNFQFELDRMEWFAFELVPNDGDAILLNGNCQAIHDHFALSAASLAWLMQELVQRAWILQGGEPTEDFCSIFLPYCTAVINHVHVLLTQSWWRGACARSWKA